MVLLNGMLSEQSECKEQGAMSYTTEPLKEHPSTYLVQDRGNLEDLTRQDIQNHMMPFLWLHFFAQLCVAL